MNLLTEDKTLLEVREWRAQAQKEYEQLKHLPFAERMRILRERNNQMLREHGMNDLVDSKSET